MRIEKRVISLADVLPLLIMALFLTPLIVYWSDFHLIRPISPYFEAPDPEFPYMMNSLELFRVHAYAYLDHPGTPVEMIGTAIFAMIFAVIHKSPGDFIAYNLLHPKLFLYSTHAFLTLANIAWAVFFFRTAKSVGGVAQVLLAAALATSFFALHPSTFLATANWSHNSFAFPFGTMLLLLLFRSLDHEPPHDVSTRQLILLALGAGIFAAVTIYLASWILCMVIAITISCRIQRQPWKKTA